MKKKSGNDVTRHGDRDAGCHFHVTDWDKLQHYKNRNPPWIKFYAERVLDDPRFAALPSGRKAHLMLIWALASRSAARGVIPNDPVFVRNKISASERVDLDAFANEGHLQLCRKRCLQSASKKLAGRKQDAALRVQSTEDQSTERKSTEDQSTERTLPDNSLSSSSRNPNNSLSSQLRSKGVSLSHESSSTLQVDPPRQDSEGDDFPFDDEQRSHQRDSSVNAGSEPTTPFSQPSKTTKATRPETLDERRARRKAELFAAGKKPKPAPVPEEDSPDSPQEIP